MKQELLPPSLEFSAKWRWKRMNKIFSFLFFNSRQWGGRQPHTFFFCFHHIPFHYFMPMLLILFFLTYLTNITCLWHVSTHDALTQHVYDMSCPSHLVYHACHGRPLLIRGEFDMQVPPFSTCTNRSLRIDLSHFKIFSHKSYLMKFTYN